VNEMDIRRIKKKLIKKHGIEPTICYYYYLYNVVDYCGEKRVRESFESIKGQGNEVICGCYLPTDKTEEIAKEYGFKVVKIEKDDRNNFPESRIRNKVIISTKCNFLVPVNINVVYNKDLTKVIKEWITYDNVRRTTMKIRYTFEDVDGSIGRRNYGFSHVFYRPYLLRARGYDERTSYAAGSQKYGVRLLKDVFGLRTRVYNSNMCHRYHNDVKLPMLRKLFPNSTVSRLKARRGRVVSFLINDLLDDFNNVKKVKNSYW